MVKWHNKMYAAKHPAKHIANDWETTITNQLPHIYLATHQWT